MSHDLAFDCDLESPHYIKGGIYTMGGTIRPELNITYNYGRILARFLGAGGVRSLYGKTAAEVIERLDEVIPKMSGKPDNDYWAAAGRSGPRKSFKTTWPRPASSATRSPEASRTSRRRCDHGACP